MNYDLEFKDGDKIYYYKINVESNNHHISNHTSFSIEGTISNGTVKDTLYSDLYEIENKDINTMNTNVESKDMSYTKKEIMKRLNIELDLAMLILKNMIRRSFKHLSKKGIIK